MAGPNVGRCLVGNRDQESAKTEQPLCLAEPWHMLEGEALDGFLAVTNAFFESPLWFVWCGVEPLHIANEHGFLARHEAARIAVQRLLDLGWGPSMNGGSVTGSSPTKEQATK